MSENTERLDCPVLLQNQDRRSRFYHRWFWWVDMRITLGNIITLAGMLVAIGAAWQRIDSQIQAKSGQSQASLTLTQIAPDIAAMKVQIADIKEQSSQTHEDVRVILRYILNQNVKQ